MSSQTSPSLSLHRRAAIVTGASRGIGTGIATELARRGANLTITYNENHEKAEEVAQRLRQLGSQVVVIQGCGSDKSTPDRVVQATVESYGKIDIIINNAGMGDDCLLENLTYEFWDSMHDTNIRLPAFLIKASLPYFGSAPHIVNISSVAARAGYNATSVYSSSKAALEGMTRALATELGQKYNATINCVNPGPVATDMMRPAEGIDPKVEEYWASKIKETPAAPRVGTPEDVAQIVAFLCEDGSRWCTGSVINANGGMVPC